MACLLGIKPGPPIAILVKYKHSLLITGCASKMSSSLLACSDAKSSPSSTCWCEDAPHDKKEVARVPEAAMQKHSQGETHELRGPSHRNSSSRMSAAVPSRHPPLNALYTIDEMAFEETAE